MMEEVTIVLFGRVAFALVVVLVTVTPVLQAQSPSLSEGQRVRLFMVGEEAPLEGVLFSTTPTAWTVSAPNGEVTRIAPENLASAQVWTTHRNTLRGALIGGGAGLVVGLLLATTLDECRDGPILCSAFEDAARGVVLLLTPVAGAAVGTLIGTLVKTGRWVPALVPQASQGGAALTMRWTFPAVF